MGLRSAVLGCVGRMWSQSLWPPLEPLCGATKRRAGWRGTHVGTATGAFGGAHYGAALYVVIATGAFGGTLYGAGKRRAGWRGTRVVTTAGAF
eukprot:9098648-Pyramimonas_sp.AAC.1